jgi:hypothetical protein
MNEERTGKCLRQVEHIHGHWTRVVWKVKYYITDLNSKVNRSLYTWQYSRCYQQTNTIYTIIPIAGVPRYSNTGWNVKTYFLYQNPVISHEWGKDREVFTTSGTYPWSLNLHVSLHLFARKSLNLAKIYSLVCFCLFCHILMYWVRTRNTISMWPINYQLIKKPVIKIHDLNRLCLSCLGPLGFCFQTFKLVRFPIFLLWSYLMNDNFMF